jgi:hypothetical protein
MWTLELLRVEDRDGTTVVTTKVDGNFDRTGLPDPVASGLTAMPAHLLR